MGSILVAFLLIYFGNAFEKISLKLGKLGNKRYIVIAIFIIVFFIIQICLAYALEFPLSWDASVVYNDASSFAKNGKILKYAYYIMFQNNIGILMILAHYFKALQAVGINDFLFSAIILNIIVMETTIFIIYLICEKLFGIKIGLVSLILSFVFIVLSPWVTTPYTDVLTMIYPVLIFYIYLKLKEIKSNVCRYILCFLMGFIVIWAYKIKPTSILVFIAMFFTLFVINIRHIKKYILKFSLVILGIIVASLSLNYFIDNSDIFNTKLKNVYKYNTPATYFLMMGMQKYDIPQRGTLYGACNVVDYNQNLKSKTKANRIDNDIKEIKARLNNFGINGYLKFLSDKAVWVFSDGTFYSYGEGSITKLMHNDKMSKAIQYFMYKTSQGYGLFSNFLQSVWVVVLFLIVYPLFCREKYDTDEEVSVLRVTLFGLFLFVLAFEGRSRYLYSNIGMFIITAMYGYKLLQSKIYKFKNCESSVAN